MLTLHTPGFQRPEKPLVSSLLPGVSDVLQKGDAWKVGPCGVGSSARTPRRWDVAGAVLACLPAFLLGLMIRQLCCHDLSLSVCVSSPVTGAWPPVGSRHQAVIGYGTPTRRNQQQQVRQLLLLVKCTELKL